MKAKDWVTKFQENKEDALKAFGEETSQLIKNRTMYSKPETWLSAADGAVREQQSKFRAISNKVEGLTDALFDLVLDVEYKTRKLAQEKKQESKVSVSDDVANYRRNRR